MNEISKSLTETFDYKTDPRPKFGHQYVLRDDKLYQTQDKVGILDGEQYCCFSTTPTTPPDYIIILRERKINEDFDKKIIEIVNFNYLNFISVKRFLLGIGGFFNYWDDESQHEWNVNDSRKKKLEEILNNNL